MYKRQVYWWVIEFGLCEEAGEVKAVVAGLLSSAGELSAINKDPVLKPWDLNHIARTSYDPTCMQPQLFVAPSFDRMLDEVIDWVQGGGWSDEKSNTKVHGWTAKSPSGTSPTGRV